MRMMYDFVKSFKPNTINPALDNDFTIYKKNGQNTYVFYPLYSLTITKVVYIVFEMITDELAYASTLALM
ncbi:hypothetical protein GCM10009123_19590 [Kangiella japonica]|uniref:Uncharacterized protein n=1 Tax=Kangiella japonica TaxID=647384 RepID=A0ABN0T4M4_9GAMM